MTGEPGDAPRVPDDAARSAGDARLAGAARPVGDAARPADAAPRGAWADVTFDDAPPAVGGPFAAWDRIVRWWHVAFWAVLGLTALQVALQGIHGRALLVAGLALLVIGLAYAVLGGRAALSRDPGTAGLYLVFLVIGVGSAILSTGEASLLLFVAFAHCWMLLDRVAWSIVASAALAVAATLGTLVRVGIDGETLIEVPAQMGVVLVFAVGLGMWTAWTMRRAEEHARLAEDLRDAQDALARSHHTAGVEAERARIAREIHDTLAQGFTSVIMQAQAASAALDGDDTTAARDRLDLIEATGRDNLAEARALVAAFAPAALDEQSLAEALSRLVARFRQETGAAAGLVVDDALSLPPSAEVVLLRVAQEALANVRRHAQADTVDVRLARGDGTVRLDVADDGRGLPEGFGSVTREGFGLSGMRERLVAAGGTLALGPRESGGTLLTATLPLEEEDP